MLMCFIRCLSVLLRYRVLRRSSCKAAVPTYCQGAIYWLRVCGADRYI